MEAIEKAAELAETKNEERSAQNPTIRKALNAVRDFARKEDVILYGGTAINSLLPDDKKFYDTSRTLPDYDMFSETPQYHAMLLAEELVRIGIDEVNVRPALHLGTFKVYANYTAVADITYLEDEMFDNLWDDAIEKDKVVYASPNFLRMAMFLELSRPRGDVSRWKKVYERLQLLNQTYPLKCKETDKPDILDDPGSIQSFLEDNDVILLGLHASDIHTLEKRKWELPIDLLVEKDDMEKTVNALSAMFEGSASKEFQATTEFLPGHRDITKKGKLIARVFESSICHSFHNTKSGLKIASIPTIMNFFLASMYAPKHVREEVPIDRMLCAAQRLIDIADETTHKRRFKFLAPIECIGKQQTSTGVREERASLYSDLKKNRKSPEFLQYFFSYDPKTVTKTQRNAIHTLLKKTQRKRRTSRI